VNPRKVFGDLCVTESETCVVTNIVNLRVIHYKVLVIISIFQCIFVRDLRKKSINLLKQITRINSSVSFCFKEEIMKKPRIKKREIQQKVFKRFYVLAFRILLI